MVTDGPYNLEYIASYKTKIKFLFPKTTHKKRKYIQVKVDIKHLKFYVI